MKVPAAGGTLRACNLMTVRRVRFGCLLVALAMCFITADVLVPNSVSLPIPSSRSYLKGRSLNAQACALSNRHIGLLEFRQRGKKGLASRLKPFAGILHLGANGLSSSL